MIIKENLTADNGVRMHGIVSSEHDSCAEKLSSGFRINCAADDVAKFCISERMRSQVRGLLQANRNCQDGISMIQAASSTFQEVSDMLQRGRELAVRASNDSLSESDRSAVNDEVDQLKEELELLNTATFNDIKIFADEGSIQIQDDPKNGGVVFQVGPLSGQYISVHLFKMDADSMGIKDSNLSTAEGAQKAIEQFDHAVEYVNIKRSYYGAIEGRLNHALNQTDDAALDITDAESRMRDADMGKTMVQYATTNILMESGISVIAQSNNINSRGVSALLGWL